MTANPQNLAKAFEQIRADYDMSRQSRFVRRRLGVATQGSGADYHYRNESRYYADIEQARDMDRNDPLVGILADRRVDNIVQSGFTLDPKTGDKGLDQVLFDRWIAETSNADTCDIAGEMTWQEIERHCCRAESIDGDIIVTGTQEGPFQVLEAHLIQTKSKQENTFLGVTTDRVGKRHQYWVTEELNEFGQKGESKPIAVRNADGVRQLFHCYNPKRVTMTRGVTQMAPVFSYSGMLEDINFAKLVQQQVVSCFAIFRKMGMPTSDAPPSVSGYGDSTTQSSAAGVRQLEGVSPGMEVVGAPGEDLQGFSPNVPNSEYFQQVKLILQVMGVNFGLPLCLVLMDGSETNFSGWRGAVDEARKGFVADQLNLVRRLHRPAYHWKLTRWIAEDPTLKRFADSNLNFFAHNWNLPTWSYIEPVADAEGDATQLKYALTSPRRMHAARGKDWEEVSEEIVADNVFAISNAMKQAKKLNDDNAGQPPISWRDLLPLPMPAGQTVALQDPAATNANQAGGETGEGPQAKNKNGDPRGDCGTGDGGFKKGNTCGGEGGNKTTAKPMSDRAKRAKAAHKMVGKAEQQEADKVERALAKKLGGSSFENSEAVDVIVPDKSGKVAHGIEHKYMFSNANGKITMNKYAQVRKIEWEKKNKAPFHTVVETKNGDMYYRRGVGSFRVAGMHKVEGGAAGLKKILNTPDDKLPAGAKRTDAKLREGTWKPAKDGRGYVNSKTGEVVRPKK